MKITYLSDTYPDFACLERYLSDGYFGQLTDEYSAVVEKEAKNFLTYIKDFLRNSPLSQEESDLLLERVYKDQLTLPTKYESISQYNILTGLATRIQQSIKDLKLEFEYFPYYTTIPTGEVNACAIKLPEAEKEFLLFDSQLFLYCHLFSKAFSLCLPLEKKDDQGIFLSIEKRRVDLHLNENINACITRMIDILENYTINDYPGAATQYFAPTEYESYINLIRDGMELMIVGHEFGHFHRGHLNESAMLAMAKAEQTNFISKNHREEYEADLIGCILAYQSLLRDGYDSALSYIGIDLFFSSMILSLRYESLRTGKKAEDFIEEESNSHPTFENRRRLLRLFIKEIDGFKENIESIESLYSAYDEVVKSIWKKIETHVHG